MAKEYETPSTGPRESRSATLGAVLDETSDLMLIVDKRLKIRESSRTAQAALGLPFEHDRGVPLSDFMSDEDDGRLVSALSSRESGAGNLYVESRFKLPDGGSLRARVTIRQLAKEGRASGRTLLIGRRLDASNEAGDSSRFGPLAARALRGYADPVLVLDAESRTIRGCNEAVVSALGFAREELMGHSLDMLCENGDISEGISRTSRFEYAISGVFQSRIRLRRKDGMVRSYTFTNVALFDASGLIESVLCILQDRSDEEARKAALARIAEEIASISQRMGSLTAGSSSSSEAPRLSDRGLTRRQIEVVRLVASGSATKAIARELGLAEATVKGHLSLIYRRLEVNSRTDLLRFIHESGLRLE